MRAKAGGVTRNEGMTHDRGMRADGKISERRGAPSAAPGP